MSSRSSERKVMRTVKLIINSLVADSWKLPFVLTEQLFEAGPRHRLDAVGAGGDHTDFSAALALDELEILLGKLREFLVFGDSLSGTLPALEGCVDGMNCFEAANVGGNNVSHVAVDLVGGTDGDLIALVEDVHLGHHQPLRRIDHVGVAQQRNVEPAAAAGTAGDGAVFLAPRAEQLGRVAVDLGRERAFADAGDIGLGDADNRADPGGADASSGDRAASCRGGAGDEGIRPVVDVEQRTL